MLSARAHARLLCAVGDARPGATILAAHPGQGASHALRVATFRLAYESSRTTLYLDARTRRDATRAADRFVQDAAKNSTNTARAPVLVVDHADETQDPDLLSVVARAHDAAEVRVVLCGTKLELPSLLRRRLRRPAMTFVRLPPTSPTDVGTMHALLLAHDPEVTVEAARAMCHITGCRPLWLAAIARYGTEGSAVRERLLADIPNPGFPMRSVIEACRAIDASGGPVGFDDLHIGLEQCLERHMDTARLGKDKERPKTQRALLQRWVTGLHDQGLLYVHRNRVQVAHPLFMENDDLNDSMLRIIGKHDASLSRAVRRWHQRGEADLPPDE